MPREIALKEVLPKVQENPAYLENNHLEVLLSNDAKNQPLNVSRIDWYDLSPRYFPIRFRQKPGPWSAVGGIKFLFPNEYNVYIHGSPETTLFGHRRRLSLSKEPFRSTLGGALAPAGAPQCGGVADNRARDVVGHQSQGGRATIAVVW